MMIIGGLLRIHMGRGLQALSILSLAQMLRICACSEALAFSKSLKAFAKVKSWSVGIPVEFRMVYFLINLRILG